jgi:hypothetical protein
MTLHVLNLFDLADNDDYRVYSRGITEAGATALPSWSPTQAVFMDQLGIHTQVARSPSPASAIWRTRPIA